MQYYALPRYSDTDVEYFSFDKVLAQKKYDETAGLLQREKILIWEKTFWDSLTSPFLVLTDSYLCNWYRSLIFT
jgi:hypothetical protein